MHHSLLWLPLLGLGLFFVWPWQVALPLYVPMVLLYLFAGWKGRRALLKSPVIGRRAMIGGLAEVVDGEGREVEVEYQGELWHAVSPEPLRRGQHVTIRRVEGLTLRVDPSDSPGSAE